MRRDPYEKIKKLLVTFGIIFVIAAIVTGIIFIGSRAANKKHTAGNGNATGSVSESVPESGTQEDDFFKKDDNGILNGKKQELKQQESEEESAPEVRDVSPDNDPNAIFPDTPSDAQPAEQEQQGQ